MMEDLFSFGAPAYKIHKPVRLIELFGGIGSQYMALRDLGVETDNGKGGPGAYRLVEFDPYPCSAYNAIHGTDFPPLDVTKIHAEGLGIVERDKYEYIMTYSFPCQDLSLAGLGRGMVEDSGTRSALIWEVGRLLEELKATDSLPQILLMENVTQVHGKNNAEHFARWLRYLEDFGYKSWYEDLEASQYGVAQHRDRCFCLSILNAQDYTFTFPDPIKLDKSIKNYLEPAVAEKYYINTATAQRLIDNLIERGEIADHDGTFHPKKEQGSSDCEGLGYEEQEECLDWNGCYNDGDDGQEEGEGTNSF